MGARRRKSSKQLITSARYRRQLKRTTFFLDRCFGGKLIFETLRDAGLKVESHHVHFKHDTPDEDWLEVAGEKKWIVFTRDKMIGKRKLQFHALLNARVKAFVLVTQDLKDAENAEIVIKLIDRIFEMILENDRPFIAKIRKDEVVLWKADQPVLKGFKPKGSKSKKTNRKNRQTNTKSSRN
jgi:hypothetical protein